ncbi:estradiol 17-beta-dehydrogenase, putative [Entamoeba histolytica HM-1:IMSS-B]|uniref:B-keto acyl reductase, putative n=6 Tax=Entamoeba histolytica TaxID=5759 RepID=C4M3T5_ENTH1|nr:b-keto acyl reductase, putative [Entamoeba histolytica HM-1:IMSS]EMD46973.1 bketo acyl reductase, putative [Entamoeba histolytica KU27]EMH74734.1 estradiol 17-beta-dehydrogenase, putative [Entamoeba histolytica HM-1:IMSS-B]EMS14353.1 b-keto acyl reductase [Entamoeba histolytica HM-3:IMSS]ENY61742.1 b-keto acyl reductase, putative [Entamoeba histolytica HM-1:IMSS-A]GAT95998.1 estradiol 17-beta-dehydrogenase putative [Entamoeba histolytica]|eukprot:XP_649970.1 b-keto acyl reductase, putative [Entamoeba histolytica HM-1:IMSS]
MGSNTGALILGIVGGIFCVVTIIPGLILLWKLFVKPKLFKSSPQKYRGKNTYAIITGAAGGIGKAFAEKFAKEGFNLIVIARREEILKQMKQEFEEKYQINVKVIANDLISIDENNQWNKIENELKGIDIGVLVNNVGMCQYLPGKFGDVDIKDINNMVSLNIRVLTMLTHIIIPMMLERKEHGLIINMSSATSSVPFPMFQVYAASKAFIKQFNDSLYAEYKGKIDCISYCPWYIKTEMTKIRESSIYVLEPEEFVEYCFLFFGQQNHIDPYWFHYLMDIGAWLYPTDTFGNMILSMQSFVRQRLLLKLQQKTKNKPE